jgi:hypothetical protein
MISESWFAIDSDDSPLRNREITTVMLGLAEKLLRQGGCWLGEMV